MGIFYPILLSIIWITLHLSMSWIEIVQQKKYWVTEFNYLKQYYLAQAALLFASRSLWEVEFNHWQCRQQLTMQFCIKILNRNLVLLRGRSISQLALTEHHFDSVTLYQLASLHKNSLNHTVMLKIMNNSWLDYCPFANEKLCAE